MEKLFSQALFWDSDQKNFDNQKSKKYVIERVITRGNIYDW